MRKLIALLLGLIMLGMMPLAGAEIVIPDDLDMSIPQTEPLGAGLLLGETQRTQGLPLTEHKVEIGEDGIITVTAADVTFTAVMPFGMVGFTQDIMLQMQQYLDFFNSPRGAVEFMINNGLALLVFEAATGEEYHMQVYQNGTSQLFHDLREEKTGDAYVKLLVDSTPEGHERTDARINGQRYVRVLEPDVDGFVLLYLTVVNGYSVMVRQFVDEKPTEEVEARLKELVEGITFH
ncbi:MAG: hypothetical protein GX810_00125 [Clostridiales bacterium]|nr:hypothetical protein [Clostridiales bacterium]